MMKTSNRCTSNIHTRSFSYGFKSFKNLYLFSTIFVFIFFHYFVLPFFDYLQYI